MLLKIENLRVNYGNVEALHGINLEVEEGEIVTILGANGAGKSTNAQRHQRAGKHHRRDYLLPRHGPAQTARA